MQCASPAPMYKGHIAHWRATPFTPPAHREAAPLQSRASWESCAPSTLCPSGRDRSESEPESGSEPGSE